MNLPVALSAWTELVLKENQDGPLVILYHLEPQYPLATLRAWRNWLQNILPHSSAKG